MVDLCIHDKHYLLTHITLWAIHFSHRRYYIYTMRLFLLFYIILAVFSSGYSQKVTVSKEMPLKSDVAYDLLGQVGENVLLYRNRGNDKHRVEVFDKEMAFVKEREITFEKKRVDVLGVIPRDSTFNMIYSYREDGDIIHRIRRYRGNMIIEDSTELFRIPKTFKSKNFLLETSENKKFSILFAFEDKHRMDFYVIRHDSLDILEKKIFEVVDMDMRDKFRNVVLTNRGEILILVEQKNSRFSKDDNHFGLFQMDVGTNVKYTRINNYEKVVGDIDIDFDNVNRRVCIVGLWHDKHKDAAKGYFYLNKPAITLKEVEEFTVTSFTPELIAEANTKDIGKSSELKDYKLNQLALRRDGGFLLFAESQREYSRSSNRQSGFGNRGFSGWMDHFFEEVVVIAVQPDDREHWSRVLFKKQFSQDDDAIFSSYFLMKTPSRLKLIFNDEIKNNNTVSEYLLDPIGRFNRNSLLSTDYQNLKIRFADAVQVSGSEFIAPSEKNRKLSLVKIAY